MSQPTRNEEAVKARIRTMLLEEVRTGTLAWYYISVASVGQFHGGYFVQARGPTEAWTLLHRLGWYPYGTDAETETTGPYTDEEMNSPEGPPPDKRWRRLSKEELQRGNDTTAAQPV